MRKTSVRNIDFALLNKTFRKLKSCQLNLTVFDFAQFHKKTFRKFTDSEHAASTLSLEVGSLVIRVVIRSGVGNCSHF